MAGVTPNIVPCAPRATGRYFGEGLRYIAVAVARTTSEPRPSNHTPRPGAQVALLLGRGTPSGRPPRLPCLALGGAESGRASASPPAVGAHYSRWRPYKVCSLARGAPTRGVGHCAVGRWRRRRCSLGQPAGCAGGDPRLRLPKWLSRPRVATPIAGARALGSGAPSRWSPRWEAPITQPRLRWRRRVRALQAPQGAWSMTTVGGFGAPRRSTAPGSRPVGFPTRCAASSMIRNYLGFPRDYSGHSPSDRFGARSTG